MTKMDQMVLEMQKQTTSPQGSQGPLMLQYPQATGQTNYQQSFPQGTGQTGYQQQQQQTGYQGQQYTQGTGYTQGYQGTGYMG